jgi:hypothetical protein
MPADLAGKSSVLDVGDVAANASGYRRCLELRGQALNIDSVEKPL